MYVTGLFSVLLQLTLFHSDEILDDDYSLMDVAYITAWNAVSSGCVSRWRLIYCEYAFVSYLTDATHAPASKSRAIFC